MKRLAPVFIRKSEHENYVLMSDSFYKIFQAMEDYVWGEKSLAALKSGFLSAKESEDLTKSLKERLKNDL